MNRFSLLALATIVAAVPSAAKADTIINLNATVTNGTAIGGTTNNLASSFYSTVTLGPGTYTATVVDTSTAGAVYNGWSQAMSNGLAAPGSWQERVGFSTGGTTFSNPNGNDVYSPYPNATDAQIFEIGSGNCNTAGNCFDSGAAALAAVTAANLQSYTFTLASTTAVTFYIPDQSYPVYPGFTDNTGGASIALKTAVTPEPSSLIMLGTGILSAAGMIRRRLTA